MSSNWSLQEVEAIVADHLKMLALELAGQTYSKAEHRKQLQYRLNGRSNGSIEFKHCNISAVLIHLGRPYIRGYQPRSNYQALLAKVVADQLKQHSLLDQTVLAAVQMPAITPSAIDFTKATVQPPVRQFKVAEDLPQWTSLPVKRDYLQREAQNPSLGLAGEEFVVQFEHWRLNALGKSHLADRVEHVSQSKGDGLGYDVLSFEPDGRERFVEVKTTSFGKDTPFFITQNELKFSQTASQQFHLYRLFEFRKQPRMYELVGEVSQHCLLNPVTYRASFG
ncbi:MAG: hypothetical protein ACD_23C00645G0004 [uncultured bacterium]|nr:MAG: hypothetical protein ACD_23C00645G0004 [uncultured bacterium]